MIISSNHKKLTKTDIAKSIGISRSSLYYKPVMPIKDKETKKLVESVLSKHSSYGHKRIAIELKINKKKILRVMKKFNLKPHKRRTKKPKKSENINKPATIYNNIIKGIIPTKPNMIWAADFTYIKFQNKFIYLATVIDLFTREIIGWDISIKHDKLLVLEAFNMALNKTETTPTYHHSDQGSEYDSFDYINKLKENKIIVSMSEKGHPWENGFQESFYSQFKVDLGRIDQFNNLSELIEAIYLQINYYNTRRIHTSLKTSPIKFKNQYILNKLLLPETLKNISFQTLRQSV